MQYQIEHLWAHPVHLPVIAQIIYQEFWVGTNGYSQDDLQRLLCEAATPDRLPLSLIALVEGVPVGTVNLIDNDDPARSHLHPWLAALVVRPAYRHRGIGSALVQQLLAEAARLGYGQIYLGTERPGFYARFGATILDLASDTLVVMRCPTAAGGLSPISPGRAAPLGPWPG